MPFLKNRNRELKNLIEIDKVTGIIDKYVDLTGLYYKTPFKESHVQFIDQQGDDFYILKFIESIDSSVIHIYAIVSDRYTEFEFEILGSAGDNFPEFTYKCKPVSCNLATVKRAEIRQEFTTNYPRASNIMVSKIRETEKEIRKALSIKIIVKTNLERLKDYALTKFYYSDDENIPSSIKYTIQSGNNLYVRDLEKSSIFFSDNEEWLKNCDETYLKNDIMRHFDLLKREFKSLYIVPLNYTTTNGNIFPIGYLELACKDKYIEESEIKKINEFLNDLSNKINDGNYTEVKCEGEVQNLSGGGLLMEITDGKCASQMVKQNGILFNLVLEKWGNPIRISGTIVYVHKGDNNIYRFGIDFKGSKFGENFKEVIQKQLAHVSV